MALLDGFIFGFFDNFILILGAYTGINIEKEIKILENWKKKF